jgi:hypothetical protein
LCFGISGVPKVLKFFAFVGNIVTLSKVLRLSNSILVKRGYAFGIGEVKTIAIGLLAFASVYVFNGPMGLL